MCGEYSPINGLPHFHAIIFGHDWHDKVYHKTTGSGEKIYRSKLLEQIWTSGFSSTGEATFESAAYIARYCMAKVTGDAAKTHYRRIDEQGEYHLNPEYNKMSLKPGIGKGWLDKYERDVYSFDSVIINGKECKPPKYYDKLFKAANPEEFEKLQYERIKQARERYEDNTDERLAVKQLVAQARINQLHRGNI